MREHTFAYPADACNRRQAADRGDVRGERGRAERAMGAAVRLRTQGDERSIRSPSNRKGPGTGAFPLADL